MNKTIKRKPPPTDLFIGCEVGPSRRKAGYNRWGSSNKAGASKTKVIVGNGIIMAVYDVVLVHPIVSTVGMCIAVTDTLEAAEQVCRESIKRNTLGRYTIRKDRKVKRKFVGHMRKRSTVCDRLDCIEIIMNKLNESDTLGKAILMDTLSYLVDRDSFLPRLLDWDL